jgi:hypothetical protein
VIAGGRVQCAWLCRCAEVKRVQCTCAEVRMGGRVWCASVNYSLAGQTLHGGREYNVHTCVGVRRWRWEGELIQCTCGEGEYNVLVSQARLSMVGESATCMWTAEVTMGGRVHRALLCGCWNASAHMHILCLS